MNKKLLDLKKTSKKEMLGQTIFDFCTQDKVDELKRLFKTLNKGLKNNLLFEHKYKDIDLKIELTKDDNNDIIACFLDITIEKILEQQVLEDQENLKRLDDAIKGANIGVWDFFPQEGRILANETWVTQKKYKDKDFRENSDLFCDVLNGLEKWASIVHPDDLEPTVALIDKFKTVNDTHGHKTGDKVIVSLSDALQELIRSSDIICRYGGEEFLILLPNTDTKGATSMSNKINNRIDEIMIDTNDKTPLKFTVSMGVSEVHLQKDQTIEEAIDRADIALYEAKNSGRNQVFIHDFLTTSKGY